MKHILASFFALAFVLALSFAGEAHAESAAPAPTTAPKPQAQRASPVAVQFAKEIANTCLDGWEGADCLKSVSSSNEIMAGQYIQILGQAAKATEAETVKQGCAASTAAKVKEVPAPAMRSAFTECANTISDVVEKTGVTPDVSHYQLLIGAVLCMDKDPRCEMLTKQLASLKG